MTMHRTYLMLLAVLIALPFSALADTTPAPTAYQFSRDGVFGCNAGQYGGSPGTTAAIGGIYVPVNDAAVTLNTGVLVYKECILRGVVDRMRETMTSGTIKNGIIAFNTGRTTTDANGNTIQQPFFPANLTQDKIVETDRVVALNLDKSGAIDKNGMLGTLNPAFQDTVSRAVMRGYLTATRKPYSNLTCSYDDVANAINGTPKDIWAAMTAFENPACSPISAYVLASQHLNDQTSSALDNMIQKLDWGGGIYDIASPDANGNMITKTPARFIAASEEQLLTSGFRQQESANDVDQMVGSLFAGMTTEVIHDNQGLAGLTQQAGGSPSYLDRVTTEAQTGLQQQATNAALAILTASQTIEQVYGQTMRAIDTLLTTTKANFVQAEADCWNNIIQQTCVSGTFKADKKTCTAVPDPAACTTDPDTHVQTCPDPITLHIATSTIYSQAAIAAGASTFNQQPVVQQNITTSDKALTLFAGLIASVTNTTSAGAQSIALQQLDQLVSQKLLHTQHDLDEAGSTQKAFQAQIGGSDGTGGLVGLVRDAWNGNATDGTQHVVPWDGTYPPTVDSAGGVHGVAGWCNYTNAPTIKSWISKWKS